MDIIVHANGSVPGIVKQLEVIPELLRCPRPFAALWSDQMVFQYQKLPQFVGLYLEVYAGFRIAFADPRHGKKKTDQAGNKNQAQYRMLMNKHS
jgi:hypothetical protein